MRSLLYYRRAVQSGFTSTFLLAFRTMLFTVLLAFALATGPLTAHAVVPTAAHVASTSMQLADGNPPQLPCTGGLPGPC